jgi:CrcB protein
VGGSFLLGVVTAAPTAAAAAAESPAPSRAPKTPPLGLTPRSKLLLGVGFCGSFTTFSTYSVDVVKWLQQGQTARALSYVAVNNVGGVVAAAAGMVLAQKLFG